MSPQFSRKKIKKENKKNKLVVLVVVALATAKEAI
jgi:hypothetical protein